MGASTALGTETTIAPGEPSHCYVWAVSAVSPAPNELRAKVEALRWYHTLELAPGVVTPGWFDTRSVVGLLPFPDSLAGRRCLDIGTYDGFWAFEMERRGADEVIATDVMDARQWDWPVGTPAETIEAGRERKAEGEGFEVAREALGSSVKRVDLSVYDLDPAEVGEFDFVYLGSLLLHLRDPIRALERVRSVCRGELLLVDNIDVVLTLRLPRVPAARVDGLGRPWWWKPNVAGLLRMVEAAGFTLLERPRRVYMPIGAGQDRARITPRMLLSRAGREYAIVARKGDPHAAIRARRGA